jgi:hypothetical protein
MRKKERPGFINSLISHEQGMMIWANKGVTLAKSVFSGTMVILSRKTFPVIQKETSGCNFEGRIGVSE